VAAANMEAAPRPDNKEERELLRWMALCAALLPGEAQALGKRLKLTVDLRRAGDTAAETIPRLLDYAALPPEDKAWLLPMLAARNLAPQHFQLARALGGTPALDRAETDLQTALDVKLPPEWRELGRQSGEEILRRRTEALKNEAGEEA
jgi:tRNA nucleotidyltransferase (CCA-adding enzyme)